MARYQAADRVATTQLIEKLSPSLLRFFIMQESTRSEAEDLLQEAWLQIHKARHTYRTGAPVLPWIFTIARHVRIDGYRKRRRISKNESAVEVLPERPKPSPKHPARIPDFETLMSWLPESQREVLTLLKVNGLSLEETATVTASTVGAIKQKASRAYATLRAALQNRSSDKK